MIPEAPEERDESPRRLGVTHAKYVMVAALFGKLLGENIQVSGQAQRTGD
jgi:hypothetical protein